MLREVLYKQRKTIHSVGEVKVKYLLMKYYPQNIALTQIRLIKSRGQWLLDALLPTQALLKSLQSPIFGYL
jgi:hypothetical protein